MFTGNDFADAFIMARRTVFLFIAIMLIAITALITRLHNGERREWIANCIIQNVDYRPNEGLRTYCENLYSNK